MSPPPNSTLDDASRANMGSQEAQFVGQAEKMIGASQEYVQNTTDPTGDLAGAAGEIAQKDPETLGAVLATPDLEGALTGAEDTAALIPDSESPPEWADEHELIGREVGGGKKKITNEMILGNVLIVGGLGAVVAGCLVGKGWEVTSTITSSGATAFKKKETGRPAWGHQKLSPARAGYIGLGVGAGLAGLAVTGLAIWSTTANKDDGSALAQGTQNTKDPARRKYLADLNEVAAEVIRLYAVRGGEAGLQLANNCAGAVGLERWTPDLVASEARLMRVMGTVDEVQVNAWKTQLSTLTTTPSVATHTPLQGGDINKLMHDWIRTDEDTFVHSSSANVFKIHEQEKMGTWVQVIDKVVKISSLTPEQITKLKSKPIHPYPTFPAK